ncbi:MAG: hybrid sensor histidine kinase/response regulator [Bdellovibrionales bacterium]|nr:hybrid sensor histidine kinase/response regulator [Bdellovibrionales bacterium]
MKPNILIIDDEAYNLDALERIFRKKYHIFRAENGKDALDIIRTQSIDVILSDQRMPGLTGVEVLKQSLEFQPDASRILLTGFTDLDSVVKSINDAKIQLYLTKPWDNTQLELSIEKAAEAAMMRKELKIKNKELETAYQNLSELDQAKSNFVIMINHELKTPLTSISSYLQLLKEEIHDGEQKTMLNGIEAGYDRLQKLIDDTLIIIKSQTDNLTLQKKSVSMKDTLTNIISSLQPELDKKSISLDFKAEDSFIDADANLITRALHELVKNAIKYSPNGEAININWSANKVSIKNIGHLDEEKIAKIFKPFYVDPSIMNHSNSTGLGISLSQAILKAHNTQLQISSQNNTVEASIQF